MCWDLDSTTIAHVVALILLHLANIAILINRNRILLQFLPAVLQEVSPQAADNGAEDDEEVELSSVVDVVVDVVKDDGDEAWVWEAEVVVEEDVLCVLLAKGSGKER